MSSCVTSASYSHFWIMAGLTFVVIMAIMLVVLLAALARIAAAIEHASPFRANAEWDSHAEPLLSPFRPSDEAGVQAVN